MAYPTEQQKDSVQLIMVGDGAVGKTCIGYRYSYKEFPVGHIATVYDNTTHDILKNIKPTKDNEYMKSLSVGVWESTGRDDYDRLRPLSYPQTSVFFLCFSIISKASFDNVKSKWVPEIRHHCPDVPIILIGTKSDLIRDPKIMKHVFNNEFEPWYGMDFTNTQLWIDFHKSLLIKRFIKDYIKEINMKNVEYIINIIEPIMIRYIETELVTDKLYMRGKEAHQLCDELGLMEYQVTSAFEGTNVECAFDRAIKIGLWYNLCIIHNSNDHKTSKSIHQRRQKFEMFCKNGYKIPKNKKCIVM